MPEILNYNFSFIKLDKSWNMLQAPCCSHNTEGTESDIDYDEFVDTQKDDIVECISEDETDWSMEEDNAVEKGREETDVNSAVT